MLVSDIFGQELRVKNCLASYKLHRDTSDASAIVICQKSDFNIISLFSQKSCEVTVTDVWNSLLHTHTERLEHVIEIEAESHTTYTKYTEIL